jgi:hypothetical protein
MFPYFALGVTPMIRERPLKDRTITLVKLENIYFWTCTSCYWKLPMTLSPLTAVDKYSAHVCANHGVPTGTTNIDDPDGNILG